MLIEVIKVLISSIPSLHYICADIDLKSMITRSGVIAVKLVGLVQVI